MRFVASFDNGFGTRHSVYGDGVAFWAVNQWAEFHELKDVASVGDVLSLYADAGWQWSQDHVQWPSVESRLALA